LPFLGVLGCATLGDSWRKRGFAVVVRYTIVTVTVSVAERKINGYGS